MGSLGLTAAVCAAAALGGFVQSLAGFGAAVVIMVFLPFVLPMREAPAVSDVITMVLSFSLFWQYRQSVDYRRIGWPAAAYMLTGMAAIWGMGLIQTERLRGLFGLFLLVLAVYFMFFADGMTVPAGRLSQLLCGGLAGLCGGFFGISGPVVSLYYLAATESKAAYLGTINAFFSITVVVNLAGRIVNGHLTAGMIPVMAAGILAILAGSAAGKVAAARISMANMKRCVYGLMIFAGIMAML